MSRQMGYEQNGYAPEYYQNSMEQVPEGYYEQGQGAEMMAGVPMVGDEYDEGYPMENIDIPEQMAPIQVDKTLVKNKTICAWVCATPRNLQSNPELATFKLDPAVIEEMKRVIQTPEGDFKRVGNPAHTIILGARIKKQVNRSDFPVLVRSNAFQIDALAGSTKGLTMMAPKEQASIEQVIKVQTPFTQEMYEYHNPLQSLDKQINLYGEDRDLASIFVDSFAFQKLQELVQQGAYPAHNLEHAIANVSGLVVDPEQKVDIPAEVAKDLKSFLSEASKEIKESFVDMNNFQITFARADGNQWMSTNNMVGQQIGLKADTLVKADTSALTTTTYFQCDVELDYVMME